MEKARRFTMKNKISLKEALNMVNMDTTNAIIDFANNISGKINNKYYQEKEGRNFDYGQIKSDSNEGTMAKETCLTIIRNAKQLENYLRNADDIPEWCQTHLAVAEDRLITVLNYLQSKGHK